MNNNNNHFLIEDGALVNGIHNIIRGYTLSMLLLQILLCTQCPKLLFCVSSSFASSTVVVPIQVFFASSRLLGS